MENSKNIFTVGHSTRSMDEFIKILKSFDIKLLADIRSLPGSRKFPHFNKENMEIVLPKEGIKYLHIKELGGRRKVHKDSHNTNWNNSSFRAYADYMETEEFEHGVEYLESLVQTGNIVYMCSEAVWWRCHRSMLSDFLKLKGWNVVHIMGLGKYQDYTSPSRIRDGHLFYY